MSCAGRLTKASVALALAGGLALLASCASTGAAYGHLSIVQFTYDSLRPETVRIPAAGNVRWVNVASEVVGFVVLPASMAKSFACKDLAPHFRPTEAGYQSHPISSTESRQVELPCALAPGTYSYEVWLAGAGMAESRFIEQKLQGTIVVE